MKRVLILVAMIAALSTEFAVNAAPSMKLSSLRVVPSFGHAGDSVYLSGTGFGANSTVRITLSCPTLGRAARGHAWAVRTDRRGRFTGLGVRPLNTTVRHTARCAFEAGNSSRPQERSIAARYSILPASKPLPACARHICMSVQASLVRLRSHTLGKVTVYGWPGAEATIILVRHTGSEERKSVHLDWRGWGSTNMHVSLGLRKGTLDHVVVTSFLGRYSGTASARFIVIPGGR